MLVGGFLILEPFISGARCLETSINWLKLRETQVVLLLLSRTVRRNIRWHHRLLLTLRLLLNLLQQVDSALKFSFIRVPSDEPNCRSFVILSSDLSTP